MSLLTDSPPPYKANISRCNLLCSNPPKHSLVASCTMEEQVVMVCVMAMISTFGVVANSTALVTLLLGFVKRKTFTKPFALFLMLSLTDLFHSLAISTPSTFALYFGKSALGSFCHSHAVISRWLLYLQSILLVTIGIDRAYLSFRPLRYKKHGNPKWIIIFTAISVVLTGFLSLPKLYLQVFQFAPSLGQCILVGYKNPSSASALAINIMDKVFGFFCMLLLVFCNILLIVTNRTARPGRRHSRRNSANKLTLVAISVMLVFIGSILPYYLMKLIFFLRPSLFVQPLGDHIRRAVISSYVMMHISSMINPVLYVLQGCNSTTIRALKISVSFGAVFDTRIPNVGENRRASSIVFSNNKLRELRSSTNFGSVNNLCSNDTPIQSRKSTDTTEGAIITQLRKDSIEQFKVIEDEE
eukprot:sb/3465140/